eukprot:COSAG05_NODE_511_length_9092_cov_6.078839_8_plen_48_part_00
MSSFVDLRQKAAGLGLPATDCPTAGFAVLVFEILTVPPLLSTIMLQL